MNHGFGIERPPAHHADERRPAARYLVVIESGGPVLALLFTELRQLAASFDAGTEEVVQMTSGIHPLTGAVGTEWDHALGGHSAAERASAQVYALDV